ncbi:MAG: hypothetical protein ACREIF_14305 [Chthoniobacterales bacterium]
MKPPAATVPKECELGPAPLVFIGQPAHLQGHIELRNRGREQMKIKHLPVHGMDLEVAPGAPFRALPVYAKLLPNEQRKASASFRLNPQTPPGIYKGEIEAAGSRRPLQVHVLETWGVRCAPASLSLKVAPGAQVARTIQLRNTGNMPYTLNRSALVTLKERKGLHEAIHHAIKNAAATSTQAVLDEFFREMSDREIEPVVVKCKTAERELAPGESRTVELEMQLPRGLRRHRQYLGAIEFENAKVRLEIEIVTSEGSQHHE